MKTPDAMRKKTWMEYHVVKRATMKNDKPGRLVEFQRRVDFTKKYFRGKYDLKHRAWMKKLAQGFDTQDRVSMSLDASIALRNL